MQYNKVEICNINTNTLPILKESEKEELLTKIAKGDKTARDKLINGNLRLVLSVIQRFTNRGENMDDLFQIGCIGLMKAIDNFDPIHEVKFSTYAVPMIIGEIRRHLRDNNSVRVSRSIKDIAYKVMQVKEKLMTLHQKEPTVDEIAIELDIPRTDVVMALESIVEPISLFDSVYSDSQDTVYVLDQLGDNSNDSDWLDEIAFKDVINSLNPREKKILAMRFMQGKTQMDVSHEIGISQAQVSRIEKGVIDKIKKGG